MHPAGSAFRSTTLSALSIKNPASEQWSLFAASINFCLCSSGIRMVKMTDLEFCVLADICVLVNFDLERIVTV